MMVFALRRKVVAAWEVVESRSVDPVPMYYDNESAYRVSLLLHQQTKD